MRKLRPALRRRATLASMSSTIRWMRFQPAGIARRPSLKWPTAPLGVGPIGEIGPHGKLDQDERPFIGGAADVDRPTEGLHAVAEADQTGAFRGIGAADAVVTNREVEDAVPLVGGYVRTRGTRMLGRVRERLRDDVVRGYLGLLRETRVHSHVELHGNAERRASVRNAGPTRPRSGSPGESRARSRADRRRPHRARLRPGRSPPRARAGLGALIDCARRNSSPSETSRC